MKLAGTQSWTQRQRNEEDSLLIIDLFVRFPNPSPPPPGLSFRNGGARKPYAFVLEHSYTVVTDVAHSAAFIAKECICIMCRKGFQDIEVPNFVSQYENSFWEVDG